MAVTIHLNGRSLSLAHKGCSGITKSTVPDVCKTPSPGGPVPIPYPVIISMSSSLKEGTTTVKVDGGNPAAIKGSEYGSCSGDEPGTAGGVKSSTNMKEATWLLYSFDVKLDGQNACRLSDKMMMNHGNAACLGGTFHFDVPVLDSCDKAGLEKLAQACNDAVNCSAKDGGPCPGASPKGNAKSNPGGSDCTTLGTKKHTCCEESIKKHAESNPDCGFESEVVFPEGADKDAREKARKVYNDKKAGYKTRELSDKQAKGYLRRDKVFRKAMGANGPKFIADVLHKKAGKAYDFKFNCSPAGALPQAQIDQYAEYVPDLRLEMIHKDGSQCNCGS